MLSLNQTIQIRTNNTTINPCILAHVHSFVACHYLHLSHSLCRKLGSRQPTESRHASHAHFAITDGSAANTGPQRGKFSPWAVAARCQEGQARNSQITCSVQHPVFIIKLSAPAVFM